MIGVVLSKLDQLSNAGAAILAKLLSRKVVALLLATALFASILPLLVMAKYDRPTDDDYAYAYLTKPVWEETGSVTKTLWSAARMSAWVYEIWQGSYTACFLMALQPGIWGESAYAATPFVLLFSLIGAIFFFFAVLGRRCLHLDWAGIISAATLYAAVAIHFLPSAAEAFYWWNGSIYYTFYFALFLVLLALILRSFSKESHPLACIGSGLLALWIAGGNLNTCLTGFLILALFLIVRLAAGHRDPVVLVSILCFFAGFLFNVCAPGNAMRMLSESGTTPVGKTILLSIQYTAQLYGQWFTLPVILSGFLVLGAVYPALIGLVERGFSFPCPLLILLGLFLLNAAGYAPLVYSGSNLEIMRLHNLQFYSAILYFYIGLSYALGFCLAHHAAEGAGSYPRIRQLALALTVVFGCICFIPAPSFPHDFQKRITVLSAYRSLTHRDAYDFSNRRNEREAILLDDSVPDAALRPIGEHPELFIFREISTDAEHFSNQMLAHYFGKDSVLLWPYQ